MPKSVKEGLEFCRDILIENVYNTSFRCMAGMKPCPNTSAAVLDYGPVKERFATIKRLLDTETSKETDEQQEAHKKAADAADEEVRLRLEVSSS